MVQLKDKMLTGLMKSFSLVDSTLVQQGFKRSGTMEKIMYELTIQDSATRTAYYLRIPATLERNFAPDELMLRIGKPILRKKTFMDKLKPSMQIPDSIWKAAESKLAEIADYLHARKV